MIDIQTVTGSISVCTVPSVSICTKKGVALLDQANDYHPVDRISEGSL